jgi:hypothetical protein
LAMNMRDPVRLAAAALVLAGCIACATSCSHISRLPGIQTEGRMLGEIADRVQARGAIEGRGTVRIEYQDEKMEVPFSLRLADDGALQIDAQVSTGLFPGLGKVTVLSDNTRTLVYTALGLVTVAEADSLQRALRAVLLSAFGGGDLLVAWLRSNGCQLRGRTTCTGLDIELTVDYAHRSIERWTIKDRAKGVSFAGLVYEWSDDASPPRVVTGIVHPREIAITVAYDEISLVLDAQ